MRSFLLLQGTIWGVAVSLFPVAVLEGTRETILSHGAEVGGDRVTIAADPTAVDPRPLEADDVQAVAHALRDAGLEPLGAAGLRVDRPSAPGPGVPDAVLSGPPDAPAVRGLALAGGRLADPGAAEPEVVLEGVLAREVATSHGGEALGASLPLPGGRTGRVVGVLAERAPLTRRTNDLGFDTEHPVFRGVTGRLLANLGIPFGDDAWKRTDRCAYVVARDARVDWILLRVRPTDLRASARTAERALHDRGHAVVVFYPPVYPLVVGRELDRFRTVSLALFVACLVMGGVVMANVGLLTALRRAGEVAIHRVEGATRRDVALQWLVEGAALAVVGVVLGAGLACVLAEVRVRLEPLAGMRWAFPWTEAALAAATALVVGVAAQALPAFRAARMSPVEALVDE
jgi:hypothetical protein